MRHTPILLILPLVAAGCARACGEIEPVISPAAAALHQRALVVDTHIDVPYRFVENDFDLTERQSQGHFDFVRAREGGLDASFFVVFVESEHNQPGTHPKATGGAFARAQEIIARIEEKLAASAEVAELARTPDEVEAIVARGKHAVILGLENGAPVEGDFAKLRQLYDQGIRYVTLTHAWDNHICDSSYDERHSHGGLTEFGRRLIPEMNRLGMMIDISHLSDDAARQVLELSTSPVLATHSSMRAFRDMERNISDELVRAVANNAGSVHINFGLYFLTEKTGKEIEKRWQASKALRARITDEHELETAVEEHYANWKIPAVPASEVLRHIRHAVGIAGVDHVGLGSDFDGVRETPTGLEDVSGYPLVTQMLLDAGFPEEDILKILGGNFMRVWRDNNRRARP